MFFFLVGYEKAAVQAATVEGTSRTLMRGDCPVAVGMGLEGTLSRAQSHRLVQLYPYLPTRTSHTLWVRTP